jgi:hypothetical protein
VREEDFGQADDGKRIRNFVPAEIAKKISRERKILGWHGGNAAREWGLAACSCLLKAPF